MRTEKSRRFCWFRVRRLPVRSLDIVVSSRPTRRCLATVRWSAETTTDEPALARRVQSSRHVTATAVRQSCDRPTTVLRLSCGRRATIARLSRDRRVQSRRWRPGCAATAIATAWSSRAVPPPAVTAARRRRRPRRRRSSPCDAERCWTPSSRDHRVYSLTDTPTSRRCESTDDVRCRRSAASCCDATGGRR